MRGTVICQTALLHLFPPLIWEMINTRYSKQGLSFQCCSGRSSWRYAALLITEHCTKCSQRTLYTQSCALVTICCWEPSRRRDSDLAAVSNPCRTPPGIRTLFECCICLFARADIGGKSCFCKHTEEWVVYCLRCRNECDATQSQH